MTTLELLKEAIEVGHPRDAQPKYMNSPETKIFGRSVRCAVH